MKKILHIFLIGLLLASFSSVSAQGLKGKFAFSTFGNLALPIGDFAEEHKGGAKSGFGFGVQFEEYVSDNFAVGLSFSYLMFGTKTKDVEDMIENLLYLEYGKWFNVDVDLKQKVVSFGFFGKYLFSRYASTSGYLKFGAGFGKYTLSGDIDIDGTRIDRDIDGSFPSDGSYPDVRYLTLGPGIQHKVSESWTFYLEATYTLLSTDEAVGELWIVPGPPYGGQEVELDFNAEYFGFYAGLWFPF